LRNQFLPRCSRVSLRFVRLNAKSPPLLGIGGLLDLISVAAYLPEESADTFATW
jgi:hypothetical protein